MSKIRVSEIRVSKIRGSEIRGSKIRGSEIKVSEIRGSEIRGSEIRVSEIRVSEIRISSNPWSYFFLQRSILGKDLVGSRPQIRLPSAKQSLRDARSLEKSRLRNKKGKFDTNTHSVRQCCLNAREALVCVPWFAFTSSQICVLYVCRRFLKHILRLYTKH